MTTLGVLLDTCILVFLAEGHSISKATLAALRQAEVGNSIYVSPISAWEIGRGVAKGNIAVAREPLKFFNDFVHASSAKLTSLTPEILVASSFLPGGVHKDPFDRILIETARREELTLVTSDRAILAYGAQGHVKTLAC